MDLNQHLEDIKKKIKNTPLSEEECDIQLYSEYLDVMAQLAEEHLQDHYKEWENALFVKEYLQYAPVLKAYGRPAEQLYAVGKKLSDAFNEHPRLKVILLNWMKQLLNHPEVQQKTEDTAEMLNQEINALNRNIRLADAGKLDQIGTNDFFKTDPVEWTDKWEDCIDDVYQEMEKLMAEDDYQAGISLHYWALKAKVLKEHGIAWKSPAAMNPDFIFD